MDGTKWGGGQKGEKGNDLGWVILLGEKASLKVGLGVPCGIIALKLCLSNTYLDFVMIIII